MSLELITTRSLIYESKCRELYTNCSFLRQSSMMDPQTVHKRNIIQKKSSQSLAIYAFLSLLVPFVLGFYYGVQADEGKYKKSLILSISSYAMGMSCLFIWANFDLNVEYLYLVAIIKSICGGEFIFLMIAFTFMVKTVDSSVLALRSILAEIFCTLGFIIGSIVAGKLADNGLYLEIVITSLVLSVFCIFYSVLITPDVSVGTKISVLTQIKSYRDIFRDKPKLILIYLSVYVVILITFEGFIVTNYLFVSGDPFLMNNFKYSLLNLTIGLAGTLFGLLGMLALHKKIIDIKNLSVIAVLLTSLGFFLFGAARSQICIFIGAALISLYVLILANLKTILSKLVPKDQNGRLFTCIFQCENVTALVIEPLSLVIYSTTLAVNSGIVFFVLAGSLLIVVVIMLYIICRYPKIMGKNDDF